MFNFICFPHRNGVSCLGFRFGHSRPVPTITEPVEPISPLFVVFDVEFEKKEKKTHKQATKQEVSEEKANCSTQWPASVQPGLVRRYGLDSPSVSICPESPNRSWRTRSSRWTAPSSRWRSASTLRGWTVCSVPSECPPAPCWTAGTPRPSETARGGTEPLSNTRAHPGLMSPFHKTTQM